MRSVVLSAVLLLPFASASADCVSQIKGPIVFDAESCQVVDLNRDLALEDEAYKSVKGLDPQAKGKLFSTYRGTLLKGLVVSSDAVQTGLGTRNALKRQRIAIYVKPGQGLCPQLDKKRLQGEVREACCDGDAEAPCMLRTPYYFESFKVIGSAGTAAGEVARKRAESSPQYQEALKLYNAKKLKKAAAAFEKLRPAGQLDIKGHFYLASAYHRLEKCKRAVPPLEYIAELAEQKKIWADEEPVVREATFLLARCYSRLGDSERATIILNTYLIEPKKFREEISKSLKLSEFGYIHTTKEYREYKRQAQQALAK
jgi:tetratricopeptide (TPR) repeat protein